MPERPPAQGRWLAALAVVALLLAGVSTLRSPRVQEAISGTALSSSAEQAGAKAGSPEDRMRIAAASPARAMTEFDEFMDLLTQAGEQPLAAKFAEEFAKEPELRKLFDDFKRDQRSPKPRGTLEAFARFLGSRAEFRVLLSKFSQDPGFQQVIEPFLGFPPISDAAHEQLLALKSSKARQSRSWLASATSPDEATTSLAGGASSRARALGPNAASALSPRAGASGLTPEDGRGVAEHTTGLASRSTESNESDAHRVAKALGGISSAGSGRDAAAAVVSLCYRRDPAITQAECDAIENHLGDYGLWESCVKANLFAKCGELCDQKAELNCGTPPDYYQTCLAAGEPDCVARCAAVPGCSPPAAPPPSGGGGGVGPPTGTTRPPPPGDPRIAACQARGSDCWWMRTGSQGGRCCCLSIIGQVGCPR